jgi:hypothetical protein
LCLNPCVQMYLLTIVSMKEKRAQTYLQFRDNDMRLLGFLHPAHLEQYLKDQNLIHLRDVINHLLEVALPGKFYHINQ